MLTVLLSIATSTLFGVADFLGGVASRRESAFAVTATAHTVGVIVFGAAVLLWPAAWSTVDVYAGVAAGVAGGAGVVALYAALARGRMSVVAPITAALSGALPALYDFASGTVPGPLGLLGLGLALTAVVIVSMSGDEDERLAMPASAIALSVAAGAGFAGSFISLSFSGAHSGFAPLLAARVTSSALLALVTFATLRRVFVEKGVRRSAAAAGLLDAAANVTMIAAIRIGPLWMASAIGSLYPVVTILLARFVLHERLRGLQRAGVLLALVAVVLTALR
ncbi:MAG: EamA family transporter [Coriobacteriia bacterium]|nr:EamA family transporter [Coriobacteriia bacterium]